MAVEPAATATETSANEQTAGTHEAEPPVPGWYEQWPESAERSTLAAIDETHAVVSAKRNGGGAVRATGNSRAQQQYVELSLVYRTYDHSYTLDNTL